jgi:homoserine kinase type II
MPTDPCVEIEQILTSYAIGELDDYQPDRRGFVNTSFTIQTRLGDAVQKYFMRRYKKSIGGEEIRFEHSVICHVVEQGLDMVAGVIPGKDGRTYLRKAACADDPSLYYYAIFEFLTGEDKYTWVDPRCTPGEIESCAQVLARFHQAVAGWTPEGRRNEKKILELLPEIGRNLERCLARPCGDMIDAYLQENRDLILSEVNRCLGTLRDLGVEEFLNLVIHCDFHPGNLKFKHDRAVGLFDFDWSKLDLRLFDVALSLFYFFTGWGASQDGSLRLADVATFLEAYQAATLNTTPAILLTSEEKQALPVMLAAANLYVLNWTLLDLLHKEVEPGEYLEYLAHGINSIRWLNDPDQYHLLRQVIERAIPHE